MYDYKVYIKITKKEDNKKTRLEYLKNYLQYIKMQEYSKKRGMR